MRGRIRALGVRIAVAAVAGLIASTASTVPAYAAGPEIQVSPDGVHFASSMTDGLFDDIGLLVPQDSETAPLWVKNPTTTPVAMRVSIGAISASDQIFSNNLELTTIDSIAGVSRTSLLSDLSKCDVVVQSITVPAGSTVRVDFTIDMLDSPDLVAQNDLASLEFLVGMRDAEAGAFPASACDDVSVVVPGTDPPTAGPHGPLAITGVDPTNWLILAGVIGGIGFLLLARRRRRESEES